MTARKKPAKKASKRASRATKARTAATPALTVETAATAASIAGILGKIDAAFADGFTAKEARFVQEYIIDLNGAGAARRAGYSEATAKSIACELLAKPHIQEAITAAMLERAWRTQVTADRVLEGIADLAYYDIAELFADDGSLKPIHEIPQRMRMAIAGVEVEELWEGRGEARERIGNLHKVKLVDRKGSLELLGRHLKLFTDKIEHSATASLEEILTAARNPQS